MSSSADQSACIAIFGDVHGHLRLMFQLCRLWQLQHGHRLDLVLQCGDLGFFPDPAVVDRATQRFARRDPEELAFARFFRSPEPLEEDELLNRILEGPPEALDTVSCPVVWCEGNHEDFFALEAIVQGAALAPVDAFGRLLYLRSGERLHTEVLRSTAAPSSPLSWTRLRIDGATPLVLPEEPEPPPDRELEVVRGFIVGALGGGPETGSADDWGLDHVPGRVGLRAAERLAEQRLDVLLSHCGPIGVVPGHSIGSTRLRKLIDAVEPYYHVFAHHGRPIAPATLGATRCFWLNDVNFRRAAKGAAPYDELEPGCMGLLRWSNPDAHELAIVDEPWMREVTWTNWCRL